MSTALQIFETEAYLFWSIVTSLLTTLFYFSVWELGLSGAEAALFTYLTPALLGITPIRNWAVTKWGRVTLRVLSLIGLAAYKINDPLERLWAVIGANIAVLLSQVVDWTAGNGAYQGLRAFLFVMAGRTQYSNRYLVLGAGLVLSSLSKHANHSNNPGMRTNGSHNLRGLIFASQSGQC